jgi:protein-tyrosine-phosphatase/DNA-binding transcriptional ArsR family regulator
MVTIARRAAVHAALGESVRLAIVDRLSPGDASPGELAELVGLGSNLLAHHLKVLQEAGVIRRVRSEGDRRRSYVQLCLDDPMVRAAAAAGRSLDGRSGILPPTGGSADSSDASAPGGLPPTGRVPRVLFVCTANSARSQLAAARWNSISPVPAASAGTHPAVRIHPRAISTGRRHGLRLDRVRPAGLDEVLRADDVVVAVCDNVHEELDPAQARLHWSIPDPVRVDTDEAFEAALADITRRVERLAASVGDPLLGTGHDESSSPDVGAGRV